MMDMTGHIPAGRLQEYIDGSLEDAGRGMVERHCDACPACRAALAGLSRLDASLKRLPLEKAPKAFAASVLDRLHLPAQHDRAYVFLKHTGAAFAFLLVAATLLGVLYLAGVVDIGGGDADPGTRGWMGAAGNGLTRAAEGAGIMTTKFFSLFSSQGGAAVLLFGVAVVGFLGVVDFLFRRSSLRHQPRGWS